MRIVCWNMQGSNSDGRLGNSRDILRECRERLGADVLIILEAPPTLRNLSTANSNERARGGYDHVVSFAAAHASFRSDRILICSTQPVTGVVHELATGQSVYRLTFTVAGHKITTFHAPYEQANAGPFISQTFKDLGRMDTPADVVIGDYNTYSTTLPTSADGYALAMHAATSNHGCNSPLDKIALRQGVPAKKSGRIFHKAARRARLPGEDRQRLDARTRAPMVVDEDHDWPALAVPDHVAIYTELDEGVMPAAAPSASLARVAPENLWDGEIDPNRIDTRIDQLRRARRIGGVLTQDEERELASALRAKARLSRSVLGKRRERDEGDTDQDAAAADLPRPPAKRYKPASRV